jgi:hypothetical protein
MDGKIHVVILNVKPSADENFVWRSTYSAIHALQYMMSSMRDFHLMGRVIHANFVNCILILCELFF